MTEPLNLGSTTKYLVDAIQVLASILNSQLLNPISSESLLPIGNRAFFVTQRKKPDSSNKSKAYSNGKVATVIHQYNLDYLTNELVDYWTRDDDERRSLRELADYFNKEVLRAAMEKTEMSTLNGEVSNTYRLLTADDVSTGVRTQAETSLERNGINPEQLRQDFASHQAIHTYLTKHQGVEIQSGTTKQERLASTETTIQRLKSRLIAVAEKRLRSLRDNGTITLGTLSVLVDIRVVCEDCGTHTDVSTLLSKRGCDCTFNR